MTNTVTINIPKGSNLQEIVDRVQNEINRKFSFVQKPESKSNAVDHPAHYTSLPAICSECGHPIECIDVIGKMNLCRGTAIKYIWRAGEKDPDKEIENLRKATWYLEYEIKRLEREKNES